MLKLFSHRLVFLLLCSSSISAPAQAANISWSGATSQDWQTPSNWVGGVAPGSSDAAYINSGPGPIIDGVTVSLGSGSLIGNTGVGALTIQDGGGLTSGDGYVGYSTGSNGTVTVDGTGSQWTNSGTLAVGQVGAGTLNIWDGGTVSNTNGIIAATGVSVGLVTVDGAGSQWINSGTLYVGNSGAGTLNIEGGGTVSNTNGAVGFFGNSQSFVTGVGSQWINSGSLTIGAYGNGTTTISDAGAVSSASGIVGQAPASTGLVTVTGPGSQWTNSGILRIGYQGIGTININDGGTVTTAGSETTIAFVSGSRGTVNVSGSGSEWINSSGVIVGYGGTGILNIEDGGRVTSASGAIGRNAGSTGTVTVTGTGSEWINSGGVVVGNSLGTGNLNILSGGAVSNTSGTIANGSIGLVSGAGSQWTNSGTLAVGSSGAGALDIRDGGTVSNTIGYVGQNSGSTGLVTVDGSGSRWMSSGALNVGNSGNGTLIVSGGGAVSNLVNRLTFGTNAGSHGQGLVSGAGSTLTTTGELRVGENGSGALSISDGALVSSSLGINIARASASVSSITLDGAGSSLIGPYVRIGEYGTGALTLSNNSNLDVDSIVIGRYAGASGTLNIGAAEGDAAVAAGIVEAPSVAFGAGTGEIVFNHTETDYDFQADISGSGSIRVLAGHTTLSGDGSGFNGGLDITGGTLTLSGLSGASAVSVTQDGVLQVNGSLGGGTSVSAGGRVQGNAVLDDLTVNSGGTAAPGNSIGTITTTNAVFNPGSLYEVEIDGAGQSDLIDASGTATLNGGTVAVIPYPDFATDRRYTILTAAGGVTGGFDQALDDFQFLDAILSYDANNVYLTLESNGNLLQTARTINQKAVASGTDAAPAGNAAINELYAMTDMAAVPDALDRLSGEIHASITGALMQGQGDLRRSVLEGTASASAVSDEDNRLWLTGLGSSRETEDTGNTAQFDQRGQGVLAGIEHRGDGWHLGLAAGITTTDLDQAERASEADATSHHVMAYGGTTLPGAVQLTGGVSFSGHDIETQRTIAFAGFRGISESGYGARSTQAFAELSRDFRPSRHDEELVVTPYLQGSYVVHRSEDFTEDGAAGLAANSTSDDLGTTTLGIRLTEGILVFDDRPVVLSAGAAWRHNFADIDPKRELAFRDADSGFTVRGAPLDADALVLTAGFGFRISDTLALNLSYEGVYGEQQSAQGVIGTLAWRF